MALLNGIRVALLAASPTSLTAGPAIQGFRALTTASGAENGYTYQWVLEANFNSLGIATDREGGSGMFSLSGGMLTRNTIWSTQPGNAQLTISGTTHLIVTPMAEQSLANTVTVTTAGTYNVTSESVILIKKTVPSPNSVQFPSCVMREDEVLVKDINGDAGTNNITLLFTGIETIDGVTTYVINTNWGFVRLAPLSVGGWYTTG